MPVPSRVDELEFEAGGASSRRSDHRRDSRRAPLERPWRHGAAKSRRVVAAGERMPVPGIAIDVGRDIGLGRAGPISILSDRLFRCRSWSHGIHPFRGAVGVANTARPSRRAHRRPLFVISRGIAGLQPVWYPSGVFLRMLCSAGCGDPLQSFPVPSPPSSAPARLAPCRSSSVVGFRGRGSSG